ncbi:MAG TPA: hypothetical protein VJZ01_01035 [Lachnospiraceae bacterium]|jgi:hypothetical protein|nr:hypothetical protein [Lachnospiraceae bacterium]
MISPIEVNGIISRTQDVSSIRHNEENKNMVDQNHFQNKFAQEVDQNIRTVHQSDDSDKSNTRHDAREKGKNEYRGDGGKNKKKKEPEQDGHVSVKGYSGFDIKI